MAWGTQRGWRWCSKCQGLWFGGNPGSKCPGGGVHSKTGSGNYSLVHQATSASLVVFPKPLRVPPDI